MLNELMGWAKTLPPWAILGAGVFAGWFRSFWTPVYDHTLGYLVRKIHVSVTIEDNEHPLAYCWLTQWAEKRLREKRISAVLLRRRRDDGRQEAVQEYELIPAYGTYYLRWNRRMCMVLNHTKNTDKNPSGMDGSYGQATHALSISIWGTVNRAELLHVVEQARDEYEAAHPHSLYYFTRQEDYWDGKLLQRRALETLYLPAEQKLAILEDFESFFANKDKYRRLGIPWRHGWLFHGPPGTGKSSLVQTLSSHFNVPIYYVSLNAVYSAKKLIQLFADVQAPGIVLIEDADCIQVVQGRKTTEKKADGLSQVVLSDLLNVMDGLVASEGRLVIMTTNHREKLDPALLRAGRIDREFHLDYAYETELRQFHDRARECFDLPGFEVFHGMLPHPCTIADAQAQVFKMQREELAAA